MIDEENMKKNLTDFSFPRLSGTSSEKKAYRLARDKIKNIDRDSIRFVNFDSIGNYCTIFDTIYKPEGYNEFYNSFLNNTRGLKIFEKSKRINFGTHSDGPYIKKKKYKGIEFRDISVYKYMHSINDTIEKVDVHKLRLLCEVIIDNINKLDK